ncbi:2,5-diamino-6-(ribosylamino)-4(3H)-pyrimidinone 5'-phosphate reductase [Halogranum amylolyticum]|uniref:2,5-diamino-6-(ribosylamino)-4(3H)-pyrimidinone 5'-phosphate reductase n=1 Tax=Halogranum amylolyticum TaxID=660520 RepID=A0A1H8SPW8_9EURY|nr:2,5-diamino-6-(ribosylamino)-4(3H)-pyrimidinone 5'-phosphate reductase [Halogranum amylolyticum]SEO80627.1 2,5-diamino-6-(ribosylamino)-4(3H)-pyrimidinone 5'-phosphate reductase [Halogranum amylolyticum]
MHVVVNAATSVDGKLSSRRREQIEISGPEDFDRMDRLRAAADAVMVGVGTVLADDPHLTLDVEDRRVQRLRNGRPGNPARVVADSRARTPTDARILDDEATTYLLVADIAPDDRVEALEATGGVVLRAGDERVDLAAGFEALESHDVERVMVEGGGEIVFSLFEAGLVDELSLYVGSLVIGGRDAPTLADGEGFVDVDEFPRLELTDVERLDDGVVLHYAV